MAKQTKPAKSKTIKKSSPKSTTAIRFAHPFFAPQSDTKLKSVKAAGTITDYIKTKLQPIPPPQKEPTMTLSDVIGAEGFNNITQEKSISFHAVGDTGETKGNWQERVSATVVATPRKTETIWLANAILR